MAAQIGGLHRLVGGKTVALKLNLTGNSHQGMLGLPAGVTYQVHSNAVYAVTALLSSAGARRIRILESTAQSAYSLADYLVSLGWDLHEFASLGARVEFEDTRNLGYGSRYVKANVPGGGSLFPAYDLNHSYVDCDVYVSLAKLKNHSTAGVTLGMKNNFGITPNSLYSQHQPNEFSTANRSAIIHTRDQLPADGLPHEVDPGSSGLPSYRVPRCIVDVVGMRPIDLTIIDGIRTVAGGEGPWCSPVWTMSPRLLLMGLNPVSTDAVATAVMGYDPMAESETGPFPGDNHLELAARLGLGTNNLSEIRIVGTPLHEAICPFGWEPTLRGT
jgi:uncharacterized protein (DUF362 family)